MPRNISLVQICHAANDGVAHAGSAFRAMRR
jgi:hypothetical protein